MHPATLFFMFLGTVAGPAIALWIFNSRVFPESVGPASIMLGIAVLIAAVFTWLSRKATAKTKRYCLWSHVAICCALCINLGGHWLLAREVDAARQGMTERRTEEDREGKRRAEWVDQQLKLKEAEAKLEKEKTRQINAEAWRLSKLPKDQRRSVLSAPAPADPPASSPESVTPLGVDAAVSASPGVEAATGHKKRLTPEEVVERYLLFLTIMAFVDCFMSVGCGALLGVVWEWDRNKNGIPDHLEPMQEQITAAVSAAIGQIFQNAQAPPSASSAQARRTQTQAPSASSAAPAPAPAGKGKPSWFRIFRRP